MNEFNVGDLKAVQGLWFYWIFRANDLIRNMFYSYFSLCYLSLVFSTHACTDRAAKGERAKRTVLPWGPAQPLGGPAYSALQLSLYQSWFIIFYG
jgi:hypothetical protein